MAKNSFYNLGFGSVPKVQKYSNVFKPIGDLLSKPFDQSIEKTKKLMALMPNGVPIEKVPEQIRGQVTEFLANNKKIYADASRDLATSLPGSDKYTDAMNTLNGVNSKFENLSASLESYQNNAKLSLESFDQLALSNDQNRKLDHSNMANGNVLDTFQIDDNGNGTFMSANGDRISFADYNPGFVDDGAMISTFLGLTDAAQKEGLSGINFDPIKYEAAIKTMFKTGGIDRVVNFAYDGVKTGNLLEDSQPIQFIHQYIENKTGKKPGDEGYEKLLEQYKKDDGLIDAFGNHLIGVLKDQYHSQGLRARNIKTSSATTPPSETNGENISNKDKNLDIPDSVLSTGDAFIIDNVNVTDVYENLSVDNFSDMFKLKEDQAKKIFENLFPKEFEFKQAGPFNIDMLDVKYNGKTIGSYNFDFTNTNAAKRMEQRFIKAIKERTGIDVLDLIKSKNNKLN